MIIYLCFSFSICIYFNFLVSYLIYAVNPDDIEDSQKYKFDDLNKLFNNEQENVVVKALDGFLIVLSTEGDVIFVAENIHEYLGIQQVRNQKVKKGKKKTFVLFNLKQINFNYIYFISFFRST